jgi:transposase
MSRPIFVRPLTDGERQAIEDGLRSSDASVLRRCQILVASARGQTARRIADSLGCSDQWVRTVIHAFNADGPGSLEPSSRRPHTIHVAFDTAAGEQLHELLHRSPREFGKPTSIWTLALVAEVCAEQGITTDQVSHETIRQTLLRFGIRWQRAKHWIQSPDPAYAQKNAAATA